MNSTPRVAAGTGVPSVSLCLSAPTVVPSAYFASDTRTDEHDDTLMAIETPTTHRR